MTERLLSTVDFALTLLGLAGLEPDPAMEGHDRSVAVCGEPPTDTESIFMLRTADPRHHILEWRGLKTDSYAYAELLDCMPRLLFDDREDPYQRTNRAYDSEFSAVWERLSEELTERQNRLGDPTISGRQLVECLAEPDVLQPTLEWFDVE